MREWNVKSEKMKLSRTSGKQKKLLLNKSCTCLVDQENSFPKYTFL